MVTLLLYHTRKGFSISTPQKPKKYRHGAAFRSLSSYWLYLKYQDLSKAALRGGFFAPAARLLLLAAGDSKSIFAQFWAKWLIFDADYSILRTVVFGNYCELSFFGLSKGAGFTRTTYADRAQMAHILAALMPENRVIVQLCMATGLRVSDVLELRTADLKRRQTVRERKTGKTRRVQWPVALYEQMERGAGRLWVFESRTDPRRHRTRQAVWKDIKHAEQVFKRTGTLSRAQNLGTHTARKYAAVGAYHRGGMAAAQRLLNHSDPLITRIYALADKEIENAKA